MAARQVEGLLIERPAGELLILKRSTNEAHALNETAAIVFDLCDGATSRAGMVAEVARRTGLPADDGIVELALRELADAGLITLDQTGPPDLSRRGLIRKLAPIAEVAESFMELPQMYSPAILRVAGASYAAVSDKARDELDWKPRPIQSGMLETFEWLAATDPARRDSGENRAAKAILIAASALLLLWLVGRSRQKGKNNPR